MDGVEIRTTKIEKILYELKLELEEYFGHLNALKAGLEKTVPKKPPALVVYDLIKSTGLPLVEGGIMKQPHIWMLQWEVIDGVVKVFDEIDAINAQQMLNDK